MYAATIAAATGSGVASTTTVSATDRPRVPIADATGALPGWIQNDIGPAAAIVTGVGLTVAGLLSGWGAVAYTRFLTRLVRRVLPSHPAHS